MCEEKLLSVIVPVYKVEPYLQSLCRFYPKPDL